MPGRQAAGHGLDGRLAPRMSEAHRHDRSAAGDDGHPAQVLGKTDTASGVFVVVDMRSGPLAPRSGFPRTGGGGFDNARRPDLYWGHWPALNCTSPRPAHESLRFALRRLLHQHESRHGDGASDQPRNGPALLRAGAEDLPHHAEFLLPRPRAISSSKRTRTRATIAGVRSSPAGSARARSIRPRSRRPCSSTSWCWIWPPTCFRSARWTARPSTCSSASISPTAATTTSWWPRPWA